MIQETLAAVEQRRHLPVISGLDGSADVAWQWSGADLLDALGGWQEQLRRAGVGVGDRVGLDLPRGPELLPAHLAVLALGACVVPLNPALSPPERKRLLERAELRTLLDEGTPRIGRGPVELRDPESPDAPALLIFTSGTTGDPKGVPHSLRSLGANLAGLEQAWELRAGERILHLLPAHHVHGLVLALYGSARVGMPIVLAPRFDTEACLRALERHAIEVCMGVPTMLHRLAGADRVPELPKLRLFTSGSAPLTREDFQNFEARFGHRPVERYGLTETLIVTSNPLHAERRAGTVGFALPETQVELDADGEILVRSPSVLPGYWRAPDTTAECMRRGFFCTGDLGFRDDDGYLVISGRKKELIIVGGSNVLPGEIERALAGDASVDELAAAGLPDPDRGETVGVFVVLAAGADPTEVEARLRQTAAESLARYKQPTRYAFVRELPRNSMGKIDRRALRNSA